MHGSHRASDTDAIVHSGSVTLVEVPKSCLIVFHGLLFHYGGRAKWNGSGFDCNFRAFNYLRQENWAPNKEPDTYPVNPTSWCSGCADCDSMKEKLKEERCNGEKDMVWKSKMSDAAIFAMSPGKCVMGGVDMLGWAVLRAHDPVLPDVVKLAKEMKRIAKGFGSTKPKDWNNIQSGAKLMQFPELKWVKEREAEIFDAFPGSRYMLYSYNTNENSAMANMTFFHI